MENKITLITGASSGIGRVTARELARMGATVVLLGRNRERTEAARDAIIAETGNEKVDFILADFASLEAVRAAADEFKRRHQRLDVLVNNAGLYLDERQVSVDGYEMTFAVNHLATFLLTDLLLETLKASAPSRIVTVSSGAHMGGGVRFDDPRAMRGYNGFRAYADSKLANILFTYELARRLEGTGVTANCLHPGAVNSNFAAETKGLFGVFFNLGRIFMLSPEQGADTSIFLASSSEIEGVTGKYFAKRTAQTSSLASYDRGAQTRLWELSEELVRNDTPIML